MARTVDTIIEEVGPFGRFQFFVLAICMLVSVLNGATLYLMTYIGVQPRYHCEQRATNGFFNSSRGLENITDAGVQKWMQRSSAVRGIRGAPHNNATGAPFHVLKTSNGTLLTAGRELFELPKAENGSLQSEEGVFFPGYYAEDWEVVVEMEGFCDADGTACDGRRDDENVSSIVTEWNLVCDYNWIPDTLISIQLVGYWLGAPVIGQLCDRFGRKKMMYLTLFFLVCFTLCQGLAVNYIMFGVFLFLNGIAHGTGKVVMILYPMEFCGYKYRVIPSCLPSNAIGLLLISVLAYFLHDWRYVTIAIALIGTPVFLTICIFPESIRYLMVCKRYDEARKIFSMMARWNGRKEPKLDDLEQIYATGSDETKETGNKMTYWDLFRNRKYAKLTAKVAFIWLCFGISYTGQSFAVKEFPGNRYANLAILGCTEAVAVVSSGCASNMFCLGIASSGQSFSVMELPGNSYSNIAVLGSVELIAVVSAGCVLNIIGRKGAVFSYYALSITSNIVLAVLNQLSITNTHAIVALSMISWFGISGGCAAVFTFTAETYPTVIRALGYSFCNSFGRFGSILGPQLVYLYHRHPFISYLTYGGVLLLSMAATATIPETNGQELADIMTEEKPIPGTSKSYGSVESGYKDTAKLLENDGNDVIH